MRLVHTQHSAWLRVSSQDMSIAIIRQRGMEKAVIKGVQKDFIRGVSFIPKWNHLIYDSIATQSDSSQHKEVSSFQLNVSICTLAITVGHSSEVCDFVKVLTCRNLFSESAFVLSDP